MLKQQTARLYMRAIQWHALVGARSLTMISHWCHPTTTTLPRPTPPPSIQGLSIPMLKQLMRQC
jgi:hypothetical protein